MINLQNKQLLLLLGISGLLVIIVLVVAASSILSPQTTTTDELITPTSSPRSYHEDSQGKFQITPLQRTEIGTTTGREVEANETITSKSIQNDTTIYIVESAVPGEPDEIRVRDNEVIFESINTFNTTAGQPPKIATYQNELGESEKVLDSVSSLGKHISAHIYAEQGVAFFVNRFTNTVYKIHRFLPMSTAEYEQEYGEYLQPAPEYPQESPN
jgi:hypothetical protein